MWWSLDNLFYSALVLFGVSVVPVHVTWLLSRNVAKLNKPCNLFIWAVKRGCVAVVTVCLPAALLELSSQRKSGDILKLRDSNDTNRFLIFQVVTAVKYIIFGTLPWMICCCTQNFNVKRLSYKIVLLQMSLSVSVTFCLSIGIVNTSPGSQSELVLVALYCHLCTLTPISLIIWNFLTRWRRQVNSVSRRTPIYSSNCISCLWLLLMFTFIPADFLHVFQLLVRLKIIPNIYNSDKSEKVHEFLLSENLNYISDFIKYIFVGLFPIFLLISTQFRSLLAVESYQKKEYLVKRISRILKAEVNKRSSVVSVSSTSGVQRSFSVVINEHHLCLHGHELNQLCYNQQEGLDTEVRGLEGEEIFRAIPLVVDFKTDFVRSRNDSWAEQSLEEQDSIDLSCLKIDLHQLHTTFDQFCENCVREKALKDGKRKKIVKLRPGRLISDEGKKSIKRKQDKSRKYRVTDIVVTSATGNLGNENLARKITTTSLGQIEVVQNNGGQGAVPPPVFVE